MTQEALKLALEFIERVNKDGWILADFEPQMYATITAIKEALAEHAMRATQRLGQEIEQKIGCVNHDCERCKAQTEQEPVALEAVYETIIHWDEGGGKRSRRELARRIVSLYTTPTQRKPLINEQLEAMAEKYVTNCYFDTLKYARAIEAAHGIKENT